MYTNDRNAYRQAFFTAWQTYQKNLPLDAVEKALVEIILMHPEYQDLLAHAEQQEFTLEENPFLHMSLHLALLEQIRADRPTGIKVIYQALVQASQSEHDAQHKMMQCLAEMMWEAQQEGVIPDEQKYLLKLRHL